MAESTHQVCMLPTLLSLISYLLLTQNLMQFDSLSHLVGFVLKLRNLGVPDHGLIRELSSPLAGSLYSGEGHSRLYDDEAVYRYARCSPNSTDFLTLIIGK